MTSRDFAYWLQGFFEITNPQNINSEQTEMIKKHLNLVFKHEIDPSMGDEKHQQELNQIHNQNNYKKYFAETEEEAIKLYGPKPSSEHKFGIHGWYHPSQEGLIRC